MALRSQILTVFLLGFVTSTLARGLGPGFFDKTSNEESQTDLLPSLNITEQSPSENDTDASLEPELNVTEPDNTTTPSIPRGKCTIVKKISTEVI